MSAKQAAHRQTSGSCRSRDEYVVAERSADSQEVKLHLGMDTLFALIADDSRGARDHLLDRSQIRVRGEIDRRELSTLPDLKKEPQTAPRSVDSKCR